MPASYTFELQCQGAINFQIITGFLGNTERFPGKLLLSNHGRVFAYLRVNTQDQWWEGNNAEMGAGENLEITKLEEHFAKITGIVPKV